MSGRIVAFEAVAKEHLKNLEDAGRTPNEILEELVRVAQSYAADGLIDEAAALREVLRQYRVRSSGVINQPTNAPRKPSTRR